MGRYLRRARLSTGAGIIGTAVGSVLLHPSPLLLVGIALVMTPLLLVCGVIAGIALHRSHDDKVLAHDEVRMEMLCRLLVDLLRGRSP